MKRIRNFLSHRAKSIVLTLTSAIGVSCFAGTQPTEDLRLSACLQHLICGDARLLEEYPLYAAQEFQMADAMLDRSDSTFYETKFLIDFGKIVAHDALGNEELCKEAITSLLVTINDYHMHAAAEEGFENASFKFSERPLFKPAVTVEGRSRDAITFLGNIAGNAPSPEVRKMLFALIDNMDEELSGDASSAGHLFRKTDAWAQQCGFWKKLKQLWEKVYPVIVFIKDVIYTTDKVVDIIKQYQESQKPKPEENQSKQEEK